MSRAIDVMHLGRDRVICVYEVGGVIVDPGPTSSVETLLEELGSEAPRALLLTHIHLDHAGASGTLARLFPDLQVYVHERGAPHLADPSRLLRSAEQLYGADMDRLWGEVVPVPEERIRPLAGGERVEGFRVTYTPGHASHHVCYLHEETGNAYVGDMAGVRVPPSRHTIAPTPPPDLDLDAWARSVDAIGAWSAGALCLTHFGRVENADGQLARVRKGLGRSAEAARVGDRQTFISDVVRGIREEADPETAERFVTAAPPDQLWLGLDRYWSRRGRERPWRAAGDGEREGGTAEGGGGRLSREVA